METDQNKKRFYRASLSPWGTVGVLFAGGLAFLLLIYATVVAPRKSTLVSAFGTGNNWCPITLMEDAVCEQRITCAEELYGISFMFGTYGESAKDGTLNLSIYDAQTDALLLQQSADLTGALDNQAFTIYFDNGIQATGDDYLVRFSVTDLVEQPAIAIWGTYTAINDAAAYATLDGLDMGTMVGIDVITQAANIAVFYWCIAGGILLVLCGGYLLIYYCKKPQTIFVPVALVLGLLYMMVYPSYAVFDEQVHISTAMALATEWQTGNWSVQDGVGVVRLVEQREGYTIDKPDISQYNYLSNTLFEPAYTNAATEISVSQPGVSYQYAPQILGILAARVLRLGQTPTLLLAQCMSLVFYVFCAYFAIRFSPFPYLFAIIGLFPQTLRAAGSFSYDAFINSISLLLLAVLLKIICSEREKVDWRWLCFAGVLYVILAPCKLIYLPIAGLLLLVPKEKWVRRSHQWIALAAFLVLGCVSLWLGMGARLGELAADTGTLVGPWGDTAYSISMLLRNPLELIRLTISTLVDQFESLWTVAIRAFQFTSLPTTIGVLFALLAALSAGNTRPLPVKYSKLCLGTICLCVTGLIFAAAITWTTVGSRYFMGAQGRYLTPVLPLAFLVFSGVFAKKVNEKHLLLAELVLSGYGILYIFQTVVW